MSGERYAIREQVHLDVSIRLQRGQPCHFMRAHREAFEHSQRLRPCDVARDRRGAHGVEQHDLAGSRVQHSARAFLRVQPSAATVPRARRHRGRVVEHQNRPLARQPKGRYLRAGERERQAEPDAEREQQRQQAAPARCARGVAFEQVRPQHSGGDDRASRARLEQMQEQDDERNPAQQRVSGEWGKGQEGHGARRTTRRAGVEALLTGRLNPWRRARTLPSRAARAYSA